MAKQPSEDLSFMQRKKKYILSCNQIGKYDENEEKCSVINSFLKASSITCTDLHGEVTKKDDDEYCMFSLNSLGNITMDDFITLKKEKRKEYQRQRYASFTPEEKERYNEYQRQWYASLTPEEKERYNEYQRQRYASLTPEEKERRKEYQRKQYASLTPDEKRSLNEAQRKKWRETHPPKVEEHISNEIERLRIKYRFLLETEPEKAVSLANKIKKEEGKKFLEFMLDGLPQQARMKRKNTGYL